MLKEFSIKNLNELFSKNKETYKILDEFFEDEQGSVIREFHYTIIELLRENWQNIILKERTIFSLIPDLKKSIIEKTIFLDNQIKQNPNEREENIERKERIVEFEKLLKIIDSKIAQMLKDLDDNYFLKPKNFDELWTIIKTKKLNLSPHFFQNYFRKIWDLETGMLRFRNFQPLEFIRKEEEGSPMSENDFITMAQKLNENIEELNQLYEQNIIV